MLKPENRINSKKELKEWIEYERKKYPCGKMKRLLGLGENAILSRHQERLRKTEYYFNANKKFVFYLVSWYLQRYKQNIRFTFR